MSYETQLTSDITEKFRYYESQNSRLVSIASGLSWNTFDIGSCPYRKTNDFGDLLKNRETILLKNQGVTNDYSTNCTIEFLFNQFEVTTLETKVTFVSGTTWSIDVGTSGFVPEKPTASPPNNVNTIIYMNKFNDEKKVTNVSNVGSIYNLTFADNTNLKNNDIVVVKKYKLVTPATSENGLKINLGENFSADFTTDICIWYRSETDHATFYILQTK